MEQNNNSNQEEINRLDSIHENVLVQQKCSKCKKKKNPEEFQKKKNGDLYKQCNNCLGAARKRGKDSENSVEESPEIPEVIYELPLESVQQLEEMAGEERSDLEELEKLSPEDLRKHKEEIYLKALSKNTFKKAGETLGYFLIVGAGMAESGIHYLPTEQVLGTKANLDGFQKEMYLMKPEFDQCLSEILLETPSAAQKLASPWTRLAFLMAGAAGNTIKRNSTMGVISEDNPDSFRTNPSFR